MYQKMDDNASKSRTRLYNIWKMMRKRCNNPNRSDYKYYGGRGIKVCEEWNSPAGYDRFKDWALNNGYKEYLTIDRINPDGDYSPENCRWITMRAQAFNKREFKKEMSPKEMRIITLTYKGETLTIGEWAKRLNMDHHILRRRINRGWPTERIIETPYDPTHSRRKK